MSTTRTALIKASLVGSTIEDQIIQRYAGKDNLMSKAVSAGIAAKSAMNDFIGSRHNSRITFSMVAKTCCAVGSDFADKPAQNRMRG